MGRNGDGPWSGEEGGSGDGRVWGGHDAVGDFKIGDGGGKGPDYTAGRCEANSWRVGDAAVGGF